MSDEFCKETREALDSMAVELAAKNLYSEFARSLIHPPAWINLPAPDKAKWRECVNCAEAIRMAKVHVDRQGGGA